LFFIYIIIRLHDNIVFKKELKGLKKEAKFMLKCCDQIEEKRDEFLHIEDEELEFRNEFLTETLHVCMKISL